MQLFQTLCPYADTVSTEISHQTCNGTDLSLVRIKLGPGISLYFVAEGIEPAEIELPHHHFLRTIFEPTEPDDFCKFFVHHKPTEEVTFLDRSIFLHLQVALDVIEDLLEYVSQFHELLLIVKPLSKLIQKRFDP